MVAALPAAENVDDAQSSTTAQPIALPPPCCQPQPKQLPDSGHVNTVCATQCVILGCLQCAGRVQQQAQHVPRRRQPGTPHTGVSCSPATRTRLWLASPAAVAPPPPHPRCMAVNTYTLQARVMHVSSGPQAIRTRQGPQQPIALHVERRRDKPNTHG